MLDTEDFFKDLQEQLDKLAVNNPKSFPEGTSANYIDCVDDSLISNEPLMTNDAILCSVLDEEGSEAEDDTDDVSNKPIFPQSSDVRQAPDAFREWMSFSDNWEFIHKFLNEISLLAENELSEKRRQADIRRLFQ